MKSVLQPFSTWLCEPDLPSAQKNTVEPLPLRDRFCIEDYSSGHTAMSKQISTLRRWLLSSPPAEWTLNRLREILIGAIRQGKVPRHIAFVMDGNRRYARSHRIETVEGHNLGFEALARVSTVYAVTG